MTPAQLAERLHTIGYLAGRRRGRAVRPWALLPEELRARLVDEAEKLQAEYSAGGSPPSRGMR